MIDTRVFDNAHEALRILWGELVASERTLDYLGTTRRITELMRELRDIRQEQEKADASTGTAT